MTGCAGIAVRKCLRGRGGSRRGRLAEERRRCSGTGNRLEARNGTGGEGAVIVSVGASGVVC
eukprot:5272441-Pleurochrysis_carterae.AAC.1